MLCDRLRLDRLTDMVSLGGIIRDMIGFGWVICSIHEFRLSHTRWLVSFAKRFATARASMNKLRLDHTVIYKISFG